jgi:cell division protein FtsB
MRRNRNRSSVNPFISLTDVLFNVVLVFILASAIYAQDISRKFAENRAFEEKLASLQLERDDLIQNVERLSGQLDIAKDAQEILKDTNLSLEEQIGILVSNLDSAQSRQEELARQISVILGDLGDTNLEKTVLEQKITVILGELDIAEEENKLLEDKVALILSDLDEAEQLTLALRSQVTELSRNNFLVVELEWLTESHDLDLHVVDPDGNRFYWNRATYPGSSARLTLDNRIGARPNKPGLEIWTDRELKLGTYRVEMGLWGCGRTSDEDGYNPCQEDALASVLVRHRDGDVAIDNITVPMAQRYALANSATSEGAPDKLVLVATIDVFEEDDQIQVKVNRAAGL